MKTDLRSRLQQLPMRNRWLRWAVLANCLVFTAAVTYHFSSEVREEAQAVFKTEAVAIANTVEQRIRAYGDVLFALRGLFDASGNVTREEFHAFVQALSLGERYPGITSISFAARVAHAARPQFERAVRAETSPLLVGLPQFAIKPPGERAEYVVMTFMEPLGKNAPAWGLDYYADPLRRAMTDRARDTGGMVASPGLTLLRDASLGGSSTLLRLALYRGGGVPQSLEGRRRLDRGMVGSTMRIGAMIEAALPNATLSRVHVQIYERGSAPGEGATRETLLFDSAASPATIAPREFAEFMVDYRLAVADREWRMRLIPLEDPVPWMDQAVVGAVLAALLAIGLLMFWLVTTAATSETRGAELAASNAGLKALSESNAVSAAVIASAAEGVMVVDAALQIESVNAAFEKITGYPAGEAVGRGPRILFSGRHADAFFVDMKAQLDIRGGWHGEFWNRRRSGELYLQETSISVLRDADGRISRYASVFTDNTLRNEMEVKLRELSTVDALTGIANRRTFDEVLAREWARGLREGRPLTLLMADVDHFKGYNDRNGHPQGDACLQQVAKAIAGTVSRASDLAARYGGEEFAVILPGADAAATAGMAEKIRASVAALALAHGASDTAAFVTISVGAATVVPLRTLQPAELIGAADRALYQAKHSGRNRVVSATVAEPADAMA